MCAKLLSGADSASYKSRTQTTVWKEMPAGVLVGSGPGGLVNIALGGQPQIGGDIAPGQGTASNWDAEKREWNQSINQSKHISIALYVASESEAHDDGN